MIDVVCILFLQDLNNDAFCRILITPIDFHGRSCAGRIAPSIITSALMEDPPVTGKFQESL